MEPELENPSTEGREEEAKEEWTPKDGGLRAWLTVVASFLIGGVLFGVINSYSVIYVELLRNLEARGVPNAAYKASLVGSLSIGVVFALSPVAGILTDLLGIRVTTVLGGVTAALGMLLSSFLTDWVEALYVTYSVMFGFGTSLTLTPNIAVLGFYFRRRLGVVNGISCTGGSVFTVVLPPAVEAMLPAIGLPGVLRVFALLMVIVTLTALVFKTPEEVLKAKKASSKGKFELRSLVYMDNWRNKKYLIWVVAFSCAWFGYFVPFVHIVKFIDLNFPGRDSKIFIMSLGLATAVSRLGFGVLCDLRRVDRILLQQVIFLGSGVLILLLSVASHHWGWLVAIVVGIGLFEGGFVSLIGVIAFELCGVAGGAQAIGFLCGIGSVPLTLGPPVAGLIFDHTNSYYVPFLVAGASPVLGGLVMFAMFCVSRTSGVSGMSGDRRSDCSAAICQAEGMDNPAFSNASKMDTK